MGARFMSEQQKRQSDQKPIGEFQRSERRVFKRGSDWFYSSREGDMGPYASEAEAMAELEGYLMLIDLKEENESPVVPDLLEDA